MTTQTKAKYTIKTRRRRPNAHSRRNIALVCVSNTTQPHRHSCHVLCVATGYTQRTRQALVHIHMRAPAVYSDSDIIETRQPHTRRVPHWHTLHLLGSTFEPHVSTSGNFTCQNRSSTMTMTPPPLPSAIYLSNHSVHIDSQRSAAQSLEKKHTPFRVNKLPQRLSRRQRPMVRHSTHSTH